MAAHPASPSEFRIVVVGAGLGGLTSALALKASGFTVQVFERDAADKAQGGGVDLRAPAIDAIARLGLGDKFAKLTIDRDEAQFVMEDGQGHLLWRTKAPVAPLKHDGSEAAIRRKQQDIGYSGARVARPHVRELLLETCKERGVDVHFSSRFVHMAYTEKGTVRVSFEQADGRISTDCDLLVGADGINSGVRQLLVGDKLEQHGYRRIGGRLEGDVAAEIAAKMVAHNAARGITGSTKHCIVDVGCSLFCSTGKPPIPEGEAPREKLNTPAIGWAFTYALDCERRLAGAAVMDAAARMESAATGCCADADAGKHVYWETDLARREHFHRLAVNAMETSAFLPVYCEMIRRTDPRSIHITDSAGYRTFESGKAPASFDEVIAAEAVRTKTVVTADASPGQGPVAPASGLAARRVTLLGDSAHPISAWVGNGATQAIIDGWVLADALSAALTTGAPIIDAIRAYERDMLLRASVVSKHGRSILKFVHAKTPFTAWLRNTALRLIPVFTWQELPGAAKGYKAPAIIFGETRVGPATLLAFLVLAVAIIILVSLGWSLRA